MFHREWILTTGQQKIDNSQLYLILYVQFPKLHINRANIRPFRPKEDLLYGRCGKLYLVPSSGSGLITAIFHFYFRIVMNAVGIHHIFTPNATDTISYPCMLFSFRSLSTSYFNVSVDHIVLSLMIE